MRAVRFLVPLFAFCSVTLVGCAHPNLAVRPERPWPTMAPAQVQITAGLTPAELVRSGAVPYRPSDFYPIAALELADATPGL